MALVQSDRTNEATAVLSGDAKALSMIRGALIDEISATDLYDKLAKLLPKYRDIFDEIKKDEVNHQGRLMDLIFKLEPEQEKPFNAGLNQKEG